MFSAYKWLIPLLNFAASLFGDDAIGSGLRTLFYRALGVRFGGRSHICGGQYINGHRLYIGTKVFLNRGCYFDLTGNVTVRDNAVIGHGVTFITAIHDIGPPTRRAGNVSPGPITVEEGAWIGANATILPNVIVGAGAIVAAGALITKSIPANTLWAGVPATQKKVL